MIVVVDVLAEMKLKEIHDYEQLLYRIEHGYKDTYEHILEEIIFINHYSQLDKVDRIYQYLINHQQNIN